jgi:chromosome partitioning protein
MVIGMVNRKGGCGKTTMAVNLAAALAERKRRVLVVDADPQQSATRWAKQSNNQEGAGFCLGRDVHPLLPQRNAAQFKAALDKLRERHTADTIIIDCPPELTDPALLTALLADLVLIPVTPSPLDIWAAEAATQTVKEAKAQRDGQKPLACLVPSKMQIGTVLAREIPDTLRRLGEPVAPGIAQRVAFIEAAVSGQTIDEYAPESLGHQEFRQLARYVLQREKELQVP